MKSLPLSLKWFVWLVLFRPLLDLLYFLKEISPFLSPLYIVAVLTPVAVVASFCSRGFPRKAPAAADTLMAIWGALLFFNALAALSHGLSMTRMEIGLRLTQPIFLYFYLRHFVQSRQHLVGLLTTFFYSTTFVFAMLLYERLVSPLEGAILTRGFERYEGLFADVNSYAAYVAAALLIAAYFFLDEESGISLKKRALRLAAIGGLALMALLSMHHAASWGVFGAVGVLLMLHSARGRLPAAVLLVVFCIPAYYFLGDAIGARLDSMFANEVAILEGEREVRFAFHGRMTRWERHLAEWQAMPVFPKLFGIAFYIEPTPGKVLGGIHNDYLRILFASGWLGLLAYVAFYCLLFIQALRLPLAERFLIRGAMAIILLYSITAGATTSLPLLYVAMTVFAYGASPKDILNQLPLRASPMTTRTRRRTTVSSTSDAPSRTIVSRS